MMAQAFPGSAGAWDSPESQMQVAEAAPSNGAFEEVILEAVDSRGKGTEDN